MKTKIILIASALILSACDSNQVDPVSSSTSGKSITVSGRIDLSRSNGASIKIALRGHVATPDANGNYSISVPVTSALARKATDTNTVLDTAKIIVGNDTLREVPLTSWTNILPTNYVVQRNVSVVVPSTYANSKVEAVWWNNDSIAHVVTLGQGTTGQKYSGFVYTVYDDSMYSTNSHLYWLFARVKNSKDSVLAFTKGVTNVVAKVGDLSYDESQLATNWYYDIKGYTLTPNDSSVSRFSRLKSISPDTLLINSKLNGIKWKTTMSKTFSDDSVTSVYTRLMSMHVIDSVSGDTTIKSWIKRSPIGVYNYDTAIDVGSYKKIVIDFNCDTVMTGTVTASYHAANAADTITTVVGSNRIVLSIDQVPGRLTGTYVGGGVYMYNIVVRLVR